MNEADCSLRIRNLGYEIRFFRFDSIPQNGCKESKVVEGTLLLHSKFILADMKNYPVSTALKRNIITKFSMLLPLNGTTTFIYIKALFSLLEHFKNFRKKVPGETRCSQ